MSDTTEADEFWGSIWWVPDSDGGVRNATPGECAKEIQHLRAELAGTNHNRFYDQRDASFEGVENGKR